MEVDHQRLLVGLCYRSPASTMENDEKLLAVMEKAVLQIATHRVLIMGDFNFPETDYASEHVVGKDKEQDTGIVSVFQHATDATRIRQNQTPSKLDYVFTDEENLTEVVNYEVPLGKSDHVVLTWTLLLTIPPVPSNQVKHNYHKGDYQGIQRSLQAIQWKDRWEGITVNEMWVDFREILRKVVDMYIPLKKEGKRVRNRLSNHVQRKIWIVCNHFFTSMMQIVCQPNCGTNTLDKILSCSTRSEWWRWQLTATIRPSLRFMRVCVKCQRFIASTFTGGTRLHSMQRSFSMPPTPLTSQIRAPRPVQTRRLTHRQSSTIFIWSQCNCSTSTTRSKSSQRPA